MTRDIPDHPVIQNMERYGHPEGREPEPPLCLLCGGECEIMYRNRESGEIYGCDLCIEEIEPFEI